MRFYSRKFGGGRALGTDVAQLGQSDRVDKSAWIALALLVAAMTLAYVDRYILAMLIQPIKADLELSDAQIGLITGFAFSAFYTIFGIVVARISDLYGARTVIVGSLVIWSAMTAMCGAAANFFQMLIARFGVGAGEAGIGPSSHATVARLFPPSRRSLALAFISAGAPIGIIIAMLVSGPLEQSIGWRWTFVAVSIPGPLLALVILRQRRVFAPAASVAPARSKGIAVAAREAFSLLRARQFRNVCMLMPILCFTSLGQVQWIPAYFERSFAIPRSELGLSLAFTQGLGMLLGVVVGGIVSDLRTMREPVWRGRFIIVTQLLAIPFMLAVFMSASAPIALISLAAGTFIGGLASGAVWALVQDNTPDAHRAVGSAFVTLIGFLVGLGLGPLLVGLLSDYLEASLQMDSLRYALAITQSVAFLFMLWPLYRIGTSLR